MRVILENRAGWFKVHEASNDLAGRGAVAVRVYSPSLTTFPPPHTPPKPPAMTHATYCPTGETLFGLPIFREQ